MALSIGFRIFSFLPSCYSSYGALNFYPGGTFTHCSCQPSLDAHLWGVIRPVMNRGRRRNFFFRVADDPAGVLPQSRLGPVSGNPTLVPLFLADLKFDAIPEVKVRKCCYTGTDMACKTKSKVPATKGPAKKSGK